MASRCYLPSSGSPPITPAVDSAFEYTISNFVRYAGGVGNKISSAFTTIALDGDTNGADADYCFGQWVYGPFAAQTVSAQTIDWCLTGYEENSRGNLYFAIVIRAFSSTGSLRGTILNLTRDNTECNTSQQSRYHSATSTQVTLQSGDYIVIDVGFGGDPVVGSGGDSHDADLRIGDNSGTDLPENDTTTNDYCPWVEFANTLTLGQQTVNESVTLLKSKGVSPATQANVLDLTSLAKFLGLTTDGVAPLYESVSLTRLDGIDLSINLLVEDSISLSRDAGTVGSDLGKLEVTLLETRNNLISVLAQTSQNGSVSLGSIVTIETADQVNGQGLVILGRIVDISMLDQMSKSDAVALNSVITISVIDELSKVEAVILGRANAVTFSDQTNLQANLSLGTIVTISSNNQINVQNQVVLGRVITIGSSTTTNERDFIDLSKFIGISLATATNEKDATSLSRYSDLSVYERLVNLTEAATLSASYGLVVSEETQGQASEMVILARSNGIAINTQTTQQDFVNLSRLLGLVINENLSIYQNVNLDRLNNLSATGNLAAFATVSFERTMASVIGSSLIALDSINLGIFGAINTINDPLVVEDFVDISRLLGLTSDRILNVYENVNLSQLRELVVDSNLTVVAITSLERKNGLVAGSSLVAFNSITLDIFESILAEPSMMYIFIDGSHAVAVLFRDKRLGVIFRNKSTSVRWRDKRGG